MDILDLTITGVWWGWKEVVSSEYQGSWFIGRLAMDTYIDP